MKKLGKFLLWTIGVLVLFGVLIIRPYDDTPYKEQVFYKKFKETKVPTIFSSDTTHKVLVGWSKENITPQLGAPMAGYGLRPPVDKIRDSIYVRVIGFEQGNRRIVSLAYDLLLVHPYLRNAVEEKFLKTHSTKKYQFYYSAIHSHSSVGGWAKGMVSKFTFGGYDKVVMDRIVNASIQAIDKAYSDIQPTEIAFQSVEAKGFTKNRVNDTCAVDEKLRSLHFKRKDGKKAVWSSFSAHATNLGFRSPVLSADYTKGYHDVCNNKEVFSMFSAGMVGSHETMQGFERNEQLICKYGADLASLMFKDTNQLKWETLKTMQFQWNEFQMPKVQVRIASRWCLSQLLVKMLLGELNFPVTTLSLNKNVMMGMPCDFSGEIFSMVSSREKPIVTSFNGSYIGYINHPQHYFVDTHPEVQDLAWLGEEGGYYAIEVIEKIMSKTK